MYCVTDMNVVRVFIDFACVTCHTRYTTPVALKKILHCLRNFKTFGFLCVAPSLIHSNMFIWGLMLHTTLKVLVTVLCMAHQSPQVEATAIFIAQP